MKNEFLKYMLERFAKESLKNNVKKHSIITISREYGCHGNDLAEKLSIALAKEQLEWKVINKEILNEAAKELKISPELIDSISSSERKGFFVDIAKGFSEKSYTNNKLVRNTISRVIQSFAKEGNIIFVGRGAVAVTRDIPKSIHIKLIAPIDYRVKSILKTENNTYEKITDYTQDMDEKRKRLIGYFSNTDDINSLFDITFNEETISTKEIIGTIKSLMKQRNLI